jgi:hypothetical protein
MPVNRKSVAEIRSRVRLTRNSDVDARILSIRPEPPLELSMLELIAIAATKQMLARR